MTDQLITNVLLYSGGALGILFVTVWVVKMFLYICPPNMILVFSGSTHKAADGSSVGSRVIFGGRGFKKPLVEEAAYMDVSLISVPMGVTGAYSRGGIPLTVHAIANIKISTNPTVVNNAIERFLGQGRGDIQRVAKETMEGHLRGVLASMTPEQVNEDRLEFARNLRDEAEADLEKLGLHLDTLKIQHVSDDRDYLKSIGRERIAHIIKTAEVAESDAERDWREAEAVARASGEVALTKAQAEIKRKDNALAEYKATLDGLARSEEERAVQAAHAARAEAEQELQRIRGELEKLRLEADITIPASVSRRVNELKAAGAAAPIAENGRAMAQALEHVASAWRESKGQAMDMFVLQNLEEIFGEVAQAAGKLTVKEVSLVDGGDGKTLPAYAGAYPATVRKLLEQVNHALGVDITKMISGRDDSQDTKDAASAAL